MIYLQIIEYWGCLASNAPDRLHTNTTLSQLTWPSCYRTDNMISSHATLSVTELVLEISFSETPCILAELSFPPQHVLLWIPKSHNDKNF